MYYFKKHPFLVTLLLLSSTLFVILYIFLSAKYNNLTLEYKVNLKANTELKHQILKEELDEIKHDIYFLSDLYNQQNNEMFINYVDNIINLEVIIENFSLRHSFYSQIRFLELNGKEFLRVNNTKGEVSVVPSTKLQDKSNRYYYKNATDLQNKEIYISPFDLNVEHGKVEKPYNPTLRIVMPLYKNSIKSGYIIINYNGDELLQKIRSVDVNGIKTLMINNEGYYFIADNKIKEWSFMFNNKYSLQKDNRELWNSIKESNSNLTRKQSKMYSFKDIKPIDVFNQKDTSKRKWTIISYIDKNSISNAFIDYLYSIFYIVLFFIALLTLFSYVISLYVKKLNIYEIEAAKSKEKLIEANKFATLGQMIENIAHQWRQPLATIGMVANNIGVNIALEEKITNEELESYIHEITDQTQYLSKTIDELRHFVKISKEQAQKVNFKSIINKSITLLNEDFKNNHIETYVTVTDCTISLKENEFIQVLIHIINNSQEAMLKNSQADKRYLFISSQKHTDFIKIKIRDSGGGIKEDIKDKIFEPYFTTKHKDQGTGLSLYIVYQIIVNSYNGRIEVENIDYHHNTQNLQGLEFSIYLPL